ncbi:tetratricopeptide repeat protein [Sphingomonas sp. HF-S4]|uniref:Tetratricopeptide repeat protein n=1 Tax=Sphingomonas agrestis TaxID=3080540 RepID=A0ABU3YDH0_9SPHN|nr:tetratricopeptide repeat protein [Sphingomonas sp. HF-S4]MDV3459233.1 tetratricopeptide repeat protein [Sphingomonas sp. HF-S4]
MDISRFNPHAMSDAQVRLLSTGRDLLIEAVIETLINGEGTRQHALISAPRGFGKSFFARAIELGVRDKELPARVFVLPEEQRNVSTPSSFLREIARALLGKPASSVTGLFLDDPPEAWGEALVELEAAIDTVPTGAIAIVVVENFDELIANVFHDPVDQSRLRALLAESQRLALLATSVSDKVDQDYEQRLFHAFAKFALDPWTEADHILYFERRAALEGKTDLDLDLAKVRALASFTGGAPRMAVALANLLLESDPLTAAELLDKLVDDLTPYYQALIDQMPMRTKTLFDALIRQGEPCSQSDLAVRVGTTQNRIAQHFAWLRERQIVLGKRRTGGRDSLYKVADRLFVQYYRKRHLLHDSYTPLAGMAELLDGFFSAEENRRQAIRLLEQGRSEEAAEFCRAFLATDTSDLGLWARESRNQDALAGLTAGMNHDHEAALVHLGRALIPAQAAGDLRGAALLQGQIGVAASRLRHYARAIDAHRAALAFWENEGATAHIAWVMNQLAQDYRRAMQFDDALHYAQQAIAVLGDNGPSDRIASLWGEVGECARRLGQPEEAVAAYTTAAAIWKGLGEVPAQAWVLGGLGLAHCLAGRFRDAIDKHRQAIGLFDTLPGKALNIALNHGWIAASARQLEDYDLALAEDRAALALWQELGDTRQQVRAYHALALDYAAKRDLAAATESAKTAFELARHADLQGQVVWIAGHFAALQVRAGDAEGLWMPIDEHPVPDLRRLAEAVLTQAGATLAGEAKELGRAAAYALGMRIIEGLTARANRRYLSDGATYLLSGLLEQGAAPGLLRDLTDACVRLPDGLSGVRQQAFELAAEVIEAEGDEALIEQADPDIGDAVRVILAVIAERRRRRNQ